MDLESQSLCVVTRLVQSSCSAAYVRSVAALMLSVCCCRDAVMLRSLVRRSASASSVSVTNADVRPREYDSTTCNRVRSAVSWVWRLRIAVACCVSKFASVTFCLPSRASDCERTATNLLSSCDISCPRVPCTSDTMAELEVAKVEFSSVTCRCSFDANCATRIFWSASARSWRRVTVSSMRSRRASRSLCPTALLRIQRCITASLDVSCRSCPELSVASVAVAKVTRFRIVEMSWFVDLVSSATSTCLAVMIDWMFFSSSSPFASSSCCAEVSSLATPVRTSLRMAPLSET
mmetsp:Transcript_40913/g.60196  ORF Transcript_40913/g.60196 Transcript_40913/m.60196 type:complete len:292 (-) Transcript_40913:548-1423(-)